MPRATAVSSKTRPGLRSPSPLFCTPPSLSLSRACPSANVHTRLNSLRNPKRGGGHAYRLPRGRGQQKGDRKGDRKKTSLSSEPSREIFLFYLFSPSLPSPTLSPSISRLSLLSHSIHRIVPSVVQVGAYARQPSIPVPLQSSNHNPRHPGRERGR